MPGPNINQVLVSNAEVQAADPRFIHQNHMKECWFNYYIFSLCNTASEVTKEDCLPHQRNMNAVCPRKPYVNNWDKARIQKRLPGIPRNLQGKGLFDPEDDE